MRRLLIALGLASAYALGFGSALQATRLFAEVFAVKAVTVLRHLSFEDDRDAW